MIQQGTTIQIIDNSGVKNVKFIKFLGGANKRRNFHGDVIKASVSELTIGKTKNIILRKGALVYCYLVTTQLFTKRRSGERIKVLKNGALVIDKHGMPLGTKAIGCIVKEFRDKKSLKILSLISNIL